jgi:hypothetical protein
MSQPLVTHEPRVIAERVRRLRHALLLLAFLAAFAFGAFIAVARADHYHTSGYCGSPHGFQFGSSKTDGIYSAEILLGGCPPTFKHCQVNWPGFFRASDTYTTRCFVQTYGVSGGDCVGSARVYYEVVFSDHTHYPAAHC